MRHYVAWALALFAVALGCSSLRSPSDVFAGEPYYAVRIVTGELGKMLESYREGTKTKAVEELDTRRAVECETADEPCRKRVRVEVVAKYAERQARFNQVQAVYAKARVLCAVADAACEAAEPEACKVARARAVEPRAALEKVWEEVSSW
jgi:hypothetical protein